MSAPVDDLRLCPRAPGPSVVAGLARCNEPQDVLRETLDALLSGTRVPDQVLVVDNGDRPLDERTLEGLTEPRHGIQILRPGRNLGCAASWNLIWRWAGDATAIVLNADLSVAPDTVARMLDVEAPTVVLGYAFGCFRVDPEIRAAIGDFDETFYPVYYEDTDYRRRLRIANIVPVEWPTRPAVELCPGRERAPTGIAHGKHDPDGYQGWRGERLAWFHQRVEANRAYYVKKWGGEPGHEIHGVPFGGERYPA